MHRLRQALRRICILPLWLTPAIAIPAFVLLGWVLGRETPMPLNFVAYNFSVYALVITITALARLFPKLRRKVRSGRLGLRLRRTPLGRLLLDDLVFRTWVIVYLSMAWNLFYAAVKLATGIAYRSAWLITLGVYYLILAGLRHMIVSPGRQALPQDSHLRGLRRYRLCGIVLLIMNQILAGVVAQALLNRGEFHYPGPLIYLMAVYAFWAVINATLKLVKFHQRNDPLLSAAKAVSLTSAMVSMLSLETALIARFGNGDELYRRRVTGALGACICLIELSVAIYMIAHATRELKRFRSGR